MKDYRNMSCVLCGKAFDESSDIVVCPECGAPHHRECWKNAGQCALAGQHTEGFEWQPQRIVIGGGKKADSESESERLPEKELIICPICGGKTSPDKKYCERCGYDLAHSREDAYSETDDDESDELSALFKFNEGEPIEGVPAGDVKRFVGGMWIYYIPRFLRMTRDHGALTFNFTAFLMHGLWFISRKMYGIGVPLTILAAGAAAFRSYFYTIVKGLEGNRLMFFVSMYVFLSGLELLAMILSGVFGNRIYMSFCARKIKRINARATAAKCTTDQFNQTVATEGGVALLPTISIGCCFLALVYMLERGMLF